MQTLYAMSDAGEGQVLPKFVRAELVDDVLPSAPLRHWVLSLPHPLRAALA